MYVSSLVVQYPTYLKIHLTIDQNAVSNVGCIFDYMIEPSLLLGAFFGNK